MPPSWVSNNKVLCNQSNKRGIARSLWTRRRANSYSRIHYFVPSPSSSDGIERIVAVAGSSKTLTPAYSTVVQCRSTYVLICYRYVLLRFVSYETFRSDFTIVINVQIVSRRTYRIETKRIQTTCRNWEEEKRSKEFEAPAGVENPGT